MTAQLTQLICRICLKPDDLLVSIFKRVDELQSDLCTLLQRCGNIKVEKSDSYSKYLCQECTEELLISAQFRNKCDATEQAVKERCLQRLEDDEAALSTTDFNNCNTDDLIEFDPIEIVDGCEETETTMQEDESDGTIENDMENSEDEQIMPDYNCDECGAGFRRTVRLKMHIAKIHPTADCYKCDECGHCFTQQKNLKEHNCSGPENFDLLHGGKKRHRCVYCCVYCGQCLQSATSLLEHIPTHTREAPYDCTFCNRTFTTHPYLVNHEKRHKEGNEKKGPTFPKFRTKTYTCGTCQRSFSTSTVLQNHIRTHTGERPFACTKCDRRFMSKIVLNDHERFRCGKPQNIFTCEPCHKTFKLQCHLTQHTLRSRTHKLNTQNNMS